VIQVQEFRSAGVAVGDMMIMICLVVYVLSACVLMAQDLKILVARGHAPVAPKANAGQTFSVHPTQICYRYSSEFQIPFTYRFTSLEFWGEWTLKTSEKCPLKCKLRAAFCCHQLFVRQPWQEQVSGDGSEYEDIAVLWITGMMCCCD